MAKSGDLGFTGPYGFAGQRRGPSFTVWNKQMNGEWNGLFDRGRYRPVADVPPMDSGAALAAVFAAEDSLAAASKADLKGAFLAVYAGDGQVQGSPAAPATDRTATAEMRTLGGEASMTGDLAWTYGAISWVKDAKPGKGHYVRVWQRRPEGWRIVFDELLVTPPGQHLN